MSSHFRLKLLAAAIGMAAATSIYAAPETNTVSSFATVHPAAQLNNGDKVVGLLSVSQPMHVVVTLKLRNEQELDQYLAKAGFKPLTSAQFNAKYAPSAEQAQSVANYLTQAGFTNVKIAANNALVEADGRADTAQAAFHTNFVHVMTHDGRNAYANSSPVQIPASLQGVVHAVLGMQNVHRSMVFARYRDPILAHAMSAHPNATTGTAEGHQPSDFPTIYGASGMGNVTSVAVGSVSSGPMANVESDLKSTDPSTTVTLKGDSSVGSGSGSNTGDGEWDLDSQDIIAFTGVSNYYFYVAASLDDSDLETDYNSVVSDNLLKAVDVSLGECETDANSDGSAASNDTTFKQAVAQGQTFFVSAGDSGADECSNGSVTPSWPASSQYVTAVGGTELYTSGTTTWASETVWNNLSENEGATGGSPSTFEPIPSWQKGVAGITNQTYRGVPDIAFDASPDSGALVTVDGQADQQIGGTSLAAPLAVGMWAHVLQANGTSLGFAAPVLYKVAQSSSANYASAFHDITSGNNDGETAGTGWDYCSGWGSVIVNEFSSLAAGSSSGGGTTGDPVASFTDTVSGLTASFTNTSTDTGGTIDAYSWNFGDGNTSTSASPSHTYSAAGTYTVTLTVTDNTGATSTKSASVTVTSAAPTQLIVNPSWSTGAASPWTMSAGTLCTSNTSSSDYCGSGESPYTGSWFAWLDGYGAAHTDTVSQTVTIPSGDTSNTLEYYLHIDTTKTKAVDTLTVQVLNSSGTVLATVGSFTNLNKNTGYTLETANLSAYAGQTITIKFTGTETSSSGNTDFVLGEVLLNAQP